MSFIANRLVKFEEYEIDRARWHLSWRDEPLPLNRKTFDLLLYLVDRADRVVGKDELLRALWPESFVEESNLTQHIFLLRKALSRHQSGTKIIETVPGRGYRFAAAVDAVGVEQSTADRTVIRTSESITRITLEEEELETSELAPPRFEVTPSPLPAPSGKRRVYWTAVGLVAAAALCVAGWFGWQRWLDRTGGPPIDVVLTAFDGTTSDPILDRALVDALRMDLAQSPFVSVVSSARVRSTLIQMMHKPDDEINQAMAREICERTNSQAVVHGTIARSGQNFLLTEEASNCVDGRMLAEAKQEAISAENLPHSIDKLAESLRQKLGESRRSIARFNTPLFQGDNTVSLDALKAYTQGTEELRRGTVPKAITLFQTAIAADPKFASAQYGLAAGYETAGDDIDARAAIAKAYSLLDTASRPTQFLVTAEYIRLDTQDLYESLRNHQNWTAVYPNSALAWNHLSNVQRDLGDYSGAVDSSHHAVALWPQNLATRVNLVTGQIQSGDLKAALATCEQTVTRNLDGDELRIRYLELAYVLHDPALLQAQRVWADAHPQAATVVLGEARIAAAEGRFSDARRLMARSSELFHQQGVGPAGDRFTKSEAVELLEAGDVEEGKQIFRSIPIDPEEGQDVVGLVYVGDIAGAKTALRTMQAKYPHGTLWNLYWGPQVRASIAMAEHKPADAAAILESARPVEMRELVVPWLRGNAYLAAGQAALAEKDFRNVVKHPEVDPTSSTITLSWLGLARALAAQSNRTSAIDAYQHFFTLWTHADPDAMYLKQARLELAALQTVPLAK